MEGQRKVIRALEEAGLRSGVRVMVGGAPVTAEWAEEIGADGYAPNAPQAVDEALRLVGRTGRTAAGPGLQGTGAAGGPAHGLAWARGRL